MRLAATLLLSAMYVFGKLAAERGVSLIETVFFRQAFAVLPVLLIVLAGPGLASLVTARPFAHVGRSAAGMTGMALNFATIGLLPLAEAQTLWFTTPLFATMLSALVLREVVGWHRWGAIAVGFAAVLIVVQPQSGHLPLTGALVGLAAALATGSVAVLLRQLSRTEPPLTIVFWFTTISALALAPALPWFLGRHDALAWLWLIGLGVSGGLGQIAITYSLRLAPVSVVAPIDYASLIWAAGFGALIFGDWPTPWTWVGAPIIVASGLYVVWREHRLRREVTPPIV